MSLLAADSPAGCLSVADFDDDVWEDLLNYIEERRVIPIIGPELCDVRTDAHSTGSTSSPQTGPGQAGQENLYTWLARSLAARLNQPLDSSAPPPTLNDIVVRHLSARGRREDLYARIRTIMRETTFAPPPALLKLAEISDFDLYLTTTFDSLLEDALNAARFGGVRSTDVVAYTPSKLVDLPSSREKLSRPLVYHLMGRLSASPTYVISDEDVLECVCALQTTHYTPQKLFNELELNHLLVIGGGFSDWLMRLFLRLAKRRRLSDPRDVGEVLAYSRAADEPGLVFFLQQVSSRTRLFTGGAAAFVDELHRRWMARRGPVARPSPSAPLAVADEPGRFVPPGSEMADRAVFISYAREDLAAVQQLKAGLDAAGINAWFDLQQLDSGDDFARKIRGNIARCSYFIPVISANTQRRLEGWFRREWHWAVDRTEGMVAGARFILPVCIDDTQEKDALVPEQFLKAHWTRLPGGLVTPEVATRLKEIFGSKTP
ncbi:MAG: toll/interleukin-1 receptor domain-containing protein [Verrucomicrobia bacterium]|nr:toll/interleukin-1 receptor domain-containing protein [Verrucomicrobiota bacterium]